MAIILRPLINEKSMSLIKQDLYTFQVSKDATKDVLAKVIKNKFKVDVIKVQTLNGKPKSKMQRTRKGYYLTTAFKKAIVKVGKGQRIAIFEEATKEPSEEVVVTSGDREFEPVKEKKSLLRGTKVRVEKLADKRELDREETRNQSQSQKESSNEKKGK